MNTKSKDVILIPIDFSEVCENALNYGAQLAKTMNYSLTIMHVIDKETRSNLKKSNLGIESIAEQLKATSDSIHTKYQIQTEYLTREGSIFAQIHSSAKAIDAKLVILGTHGKKGMQYLIGSHALRVISKIPVPTIVIQNKAFREYKRIVFPITDFTEAREKIKWAVTIAKIYEADIHLFIQNQPDPGLQFKIQTIQQQVIESFEKNNIAYQVKVAGKKSHLSRQIVKYASDINAELIMIMIEPDVYSSDYKIGPWDEVIMFNDAEVPVMCINPKELTEK